MKEVTKEKIFEIVNANMENGAVTPEQYENDLSEFGMDSITFIHIIVSLEEEFECEVPEFKLIVSEMNTVRKIYETLEALSRIPSDKVSI